MKCKIKIFPEIGNIYFVDIALSQMTIDEWIEDNLNFVEHYEIMEVK